MGWGRFFERWSRDRERAREMRTHIDLHTDHLVAQGVAPDEARRRARVSFGNPRVKREEVDDMNRLPLLDVLGRDVKYAVRVLRRTPAFTITAVATLALVIGANTAVFSLADAILIRPLPYPHPERLAYVETMRQSTKGLDTDDSQDGTSWEALRDNAKAVDVAMTASGFGHDVNLVANNAAALVGQARVSAGYFRVLGVPPFIGREFSRDEDRPGGPAVAVISYPMWQRLFQGDRSAVGRTIMLRGESYEVLGIMPEGFQNPGSAADVWTPARPSRTGEGGGTNYGVIARLRDGHSWREAYGELAQVGNASFRSRPGLKLEAGEAMWYTLRPMQDELVDGVREPIEMLAGSVGMVLLIACVNLAALLLSRGSSRSKEIATRMALGSGRAAVVRQLMVESIALGLTGGAIGLLVGFLGLEGLKALGGQTFNEWKSVTLDSRALAATAGLSLVTSFLFGVVPAIQASRLDLNAALIDGGSRSIAGGSRNWTRRVLVMAQVSLSVVLLVLTGLLIRTFVNLQSLDPGFDPTHLVTASVSLQDARYQTAARINQFFDSALFELQRTPGVQAASVSLELPYKRLLNNGFVFDDEAPDPKLSPIANFAYVSPQFFDTFRIALRSGRVFTDADRDGSQPVVVVNDTFVRIWAKGVSPIGRYLGKGPTKQKIVGVVGDVQVSNSGFLVQGMTRGPLMTTPLVFVPAAQTSDRFFKMVHTWFSPVFSIRTTGSVNAEAVFQRAIGAADPLLPLGKVQSMTAVQGTATARQRLLMILVGALASVALLLAAIGIHGLIAHAIAERTREFGIRMALGATAGQTIRAVALSGVTLSVVGAIIGGGLSVLAVRLVDSSFLFRVEKQDPATYVGVAVFLMVIASIASVLPSLKILRLDPAKTLRQ